MIDTLAPTPKSKLPEIHPGDIVRVHQKITEGGKERVQVFEGIVIKTHRKTGPNATFTVRKIASGVGVERTYLLQSPDIVKIEFKKGSQVRRAKLYHLRDLSGKALKMKEKKLDRDIWELVAKGEEPLEASAEELAEAVKAAAQEEPIESSEPSLPPAHDTLKNTTKDGDAPKGDTVDAEVNGGSQAGETQP